MMNHEPRKLTSYDVPVSCVPAQPPCYTANPPGSSAPPSILIVDDDEFCRELLCSALKNRGFLCLQAENGMAALRVIQEAWIALIITDYQMPIMNGCEFLEQLSLVNPYPPPAFMMTGNFTESIHDRALKAGAIMVLPKPIDLNYLLTLFNPYLRQPNRTF